MNRKVFLVNEKQDICIGTVGQIVRGEFCLSDFKRLVMETVLEMQLDECFDDDGLSFVIELR